MDSEIVPSAPLDARGVVGQLVEVTPFVIPPSWKKIVGSHAKAMLAEGIPVDVVFAACYMAILRGKPQVAQYIAGDLMLAATGQRMSRSEYEQKLALYNADHVGRADLLREQRERRGL